jgi:iron complex outermembrane receptor protein
MLSLRVTNTSGTCIPFTCCALALSISSVIAAFPVHAQGELTDEEMAAFYDDDESVSIATGTSKPLHRAPAVASVITADQIRKMGARTLDEVLETVPGLHVSRSFNRLNSLYSIRGIHTGNNPQVQLLLNGSQIVETATGGRPPTFSMPVANIKRIEVIRGPGSAVYGADAFAGVIDIVTKDAADVNGTVVGARAGSFDSQDAWVQGGFVENDLSAKISLDYSRSDGDNDRIIDRDLQSLLDGAYGTNASHAPGALDTNYETFNGEIKISKGAWSFSTYRWEQHHAGVGPGSSQALDPGGEQDVQYQQYEVRYEKALSEQWELNAKLLHTYEEQQSEFTLFPPGVLLFLTPDGNIAFVPSGGPPVIAPFGIRGNPGGEEKNTLAEIVTFYRGFSGHVVRFAVGAKRVDQHAFESKNFGPGVTDGSETQLSDRMVDVTGTPYIFISDEKRDAQWLTLQDEWGFAQDWELTAGVRFDHYSDFGDTVNPRLALVWETAYNLTSKLMYGRAFRAPAFDELYIQNNPSIKGNELLDPEIVDTLELAFDYRPVADVVTKLNLFLYQAKDVIEFVGNDQGTARLAENAKDQEGRGFELEAKWDVTRRFDLAGSISFQESEDEGIDAWVPDAPRLRVYGAANWALTDAWNWQLNINHVADRKRAVIDARDPVDDYTLLGTSISYSIAPLDLLTRFSIRNLTDEEAYEPSNVEPTGISAIPGDYPLEGRSYWLDAEYRF